MSEVLIISLYIAEISLNPLNTVRFKKYYAALYRNRNVEIRMQPGEGWEELRSGPCSRQCTGSAAPLA